MNSLFPNLTWSPMLPAPYVAGIGLLLLGLAVAAYARAGGLGVAARGFLLVLRALALGVLLAVLLRPMRVVSAPNPDRKPIFSLLVDTSASMNTRDEGERSRWEAAHGAIVQGEGTYLWQLARDYQFNTRTFADQARLATIPEVKALERVEGPKTDLAGALAAVGHEAGLGAHAGVCVISDGRDNAGGDVAAAIGMLRARQVPAWTVCLGTATSVRDVHVRGRFNQNFLFAKQPARLHVTLAQSGFDGFHVNAHLYREDRYVETRQAVLQQGLVQLEFPVREERKGLFKYTVRVDPVPGETDTRNNERVLFARVVDQKTRVLLVEARPHWDSKFLLRALQEDPNLEVTSIFHLAPHKVFAVRERTSGETLEEETTVAALQMPKTREELYPYDCVLLGKDMDTLLTAEETKVLRDYVAERGGSVVFFRGRPYRGASELGDLEPLVWDDEVLRDVQLELTEEGEVSPIFALDAPQPADVLVRSLPAMTSVTRVRGEKSLAVVLATGGAPGVKTDRLAAMAYQRYGKGKVMTLAAAGLWRWSFLPDGLNDLQGIYQRLWAQIVRWLVFDTDFLPGQDITFRSERYAYQPGERVRFVARTRQILPDRYFPRVTVHPPEGPPLVLTPVRVEGTADYVVDFTPEAEGEYRAVLENNVGQPRTDVTRFTAYADFEEMRLASSDRELMAHLARQTGGDVLALDDLPSLPERARAFAALAADTPRAEDAWDNGLLFGLLFGLLCLEWLLRRAWGAL